MKTVEDILTRVRPRRAIEGLTAVLLPFKDSGVIDFDSFSRHLDSTASSGLTPAVNMDTGYANLLTVDERQNVLEVTRSVLNGRGFIAGAFIEGATGHPLDLYRHEVTLIQAYGGLPILFQCSAMKMMQADELVNLYRVIAEQAGNLIIFELGSMFAPFGQIYNLSLVEQLMCIPQIKGLKHSSLSRELEWQRLVLRDRLRPDFKIYTGNDLGIDMVMYGSDYLLGLSTFAPEAFALRDRFWAEGDPRFYELNDLLQYLGTFAFRPPVPAYKHSAAQFLKLRSRIVSDAPHPAAMRRPISDIEILRDIAARLDEWCV